LIARVDPNLSEIEFLADDMFSVEIDFNDGVSNPETVLVRRPTFLIGGSDASHVAVDDMKVLAFDLMISREIGKRFSCRPVMTNTAKTTPTKLFDGVYEGTTRMELGPVSLQITSLDLDLLLREGEAPDRAGVRIIRQASVSKAPQIPALVFPGKSPFVVSFAPDQPVYVGRSRECTVRLDVQDISSRHARLGYEGGQFWIEDLGSTNGTFLNQQQISGRVFFAPGVPVLLGRETVVFGANSEEQVQSLSKLKDDNQRSLAPERRYPLLLSLSEVVRPARMVVPVGMIVHIGRDPKSELWLGAPHISRQHCQVALSKTGDLTITDCSTNGTAHDGGLLLKGDVMDLKGQPRVLDFGGGVTVAICFSADDEQVFIDSAGSVTAFTMKVEKPIGEDEVERPVPKKSAPQVGSRAYRSRDLRPAPRSVISELLNSFSALPLVKKIMVGLWIGAALMLSIVVGNLVMGIFE
jgi:pSer/pThr/pTyr-binding forkhead associated (FHA) protein